MHACYGLAVGHKKDLQAIPRKKYFPVLHSMGTSEYPANSIRLSQKEYEHLYSTQREKKPEVSGYKL